MATWLAPATATPTETVTGSSMPRLAGMQAHDRAADALADLDGLLGRGPPQEHRELLAAVAGRRVLGADALGDGAGHGAQDAVPGGVAEAVVEDLEVVDVDHQDAQAVVGAAARPLHAQGLVEVAAVRQPGQHVDLGAPLGGLERIGARERRGHLAGGPGEQATVALAPGAPSAARQQERAEEAPVGDERRGQRVRQPVRRADAAGDLLGRGGRLVRRVAGGLADAVVAAAAPRTPGASSSGRSVVRDGGASARAATSVTSTCLSGWLTRATTTWSASVAARRSEMTVSTTDSGDSERESPEATRRMAASRSRRSRVSAAVVSGHHVERQHERQERQRRRRRRGARCPRRRAASRSRWRGPARLPRTHQARPAPAGG